MKKTVVFILLVSICLISFSQSKKKKEIYPLWELEVVNSNLLPILDTIIKMKNESVAFKPATLFAIEFDWDSIKTDLIAIRVLGFRLYYNDPDILGYFDHGLCTFIVKGDSINTSIFQQSENYSMFNFSRDSMSYIDHEGILTVDQFALSDIFAVWTVRYIQGNFKLLSFWTDEDEDKWFDNVGKEYGEDE